MRYLLITLISFTLGVNAAQVNGNKMSESRAGFVENKGQIHDQLNHPNPSVLYLLNTSGLNVQIKQTGFSYDTYIIDKKQKVSDGLDKPKEKTDLPDQFDITYKFHRIDVELEGMNRNAKIVAEERSSDFVNYYNVQGAPDGVLDVRSYQKIIFKEVYKGIDLEYIIEKGTFKYNFIVHPGADYRRIKLRYKGAPVSMKNGVLNFSLEQGILEERIPKSWYELNGKQEQVAIIYKQIADNLFGFEGEKIETEKTLVIDPNPGKVWATYYGGTGNEAGDATVRVDGSGNVFMSGFSGSSTLIATTGAYQVTFSGGNYDALVVKFDANGVRQWATYYGGSLEEFGTGGSGNCSVDGNGNVYLVGLTNSTTLIASVGSHQASFAGGYDAFLVKLNANGIRQWATYYGGPASEVNNVSCATDPSGNIYLSGITQSTNGISTVGSHQETTAGNMESFLVKFDGNGVRLWGTYYGGASNEVLSGCATDANGNVFLSGLTSSTAGISTPGSHQATIGAGQDAFLVKFNASGVRLWGTYYGGSSTELGGAGLATDASGNIYLSGVTQSADGIATVGAHQASHGGASYDTYLVKFNTNGVRQWGTYYGGTGNDQGAVSCSADPTGNIYLSGLTTSANGTSIATAGAHQVTLNGGADAFLVKFNSNGVRQWGTYYGGANNEEYNVSCVANAGGVFICSSTASSTGIHSALGAHQASLGGGYDLFLAKLRDCTGGGTLGAMPAINTPSPAIVCSGAPRTFSLSSAVTNAASYYWTVPNGWKIVSGQGTINLSVIPSASGPSNISVRAYNLCGDSTSTAATLQVTITTSPAKPASLTSASGQLVNGVRTFCAGSSISFTCGTVAGSNYNWIYWGNTSSTANNTRSATAGSVNDTIRVYVTSTSTGCPSDTQKLFVQSFQTPLTPTGITGNTTVCVGKPNLFVSDSMQYATSYTWTYPGGWTRTTTRTDTMSVLLTPPTTTGGPITVAARNFCGVSSAKSITISASTTVPTTPSVIVGNATPCGNASETYSVTNDPLVKYRWVLPTGWTIQSGDSTNSITVKTGSVSGSVQVYAYQLINPVCESAVQSKAVTIQTTPAKPGLITGDTNVCVSTSAGFYSINAVPNATSYTWTLPLGWSGSSTGSSINLAAGSTSGYVTLKVKALAGTCASLDTSLTINVSPALGALSGITGNTTMCANSSQKYSIPVVTNATGYTWTLPSGWTYTGKSDSNVVNVVVSSFNGQVTVSAVNKGCTSNPQSLNITTVNASPNTPGTITPSATACSGNTVQFSIVAVPNAISYTWTKPPGWSGTSGTNSINITLNAVSDTLRVVANGAGGCNSAQQKLYVAISTTPAAPVSLLGSTTVCNGTTELYRVSKVTGATSYQWTYPSGWSGSTVTTDTFVYASVGSSSGTLSAKASSNMGCLSTAKSTGNITVSTVIPQTPSSINGTGSFCANVAKSYTVPAVTGATGYLWVVPTGWVINSGQNTTGISVTPNTTTGYVTVQSVQGGCKSSGTQSLWNGSMRTKPNTVTITLNQPQPCVGTQTSINCSSAGDADSYLWTVPSGWTITGGQGGTFISAQVGSGSGSVTVVPKNAGCDGQTTSSAVTASTPPVIDGGISGESYVKSYTVRKYWITPVAGATSYNWSVPAGWNIIDGAYSDMMSVLTGSNSGTVSVSVANSCGNNFKALQVYSGVATSLDEHSLCSVVDVFPVPASDKLSLKLIPKENMNLNWRMVNMMGQELQTGVFNGLQNNTPYETTMDVSQIPAGIYLLNLYNDEKAEYIRISISR